MSTSTPETTSKPMISIWVWVGLVLTVYGAIITAMGIRYAIEPEMATATAELNPSLWWGCIMVAVGAAFLVAGRRRAGAR